MDMIAWDCLTAQCKVQNDGCKALLAVFHQQQQPVVSRNLAPRIAKRRGKASANRGDRTWRSSTYGSLVLDQAGADRGLSQPVTPSTRNVTDGWFLAAPAGRR